MTPDKLWGQGERRSLLAKVGTAAAVVVIVALGLLSLRPVLGDQPLQPTSPTNGELGFPDNLYDMPKNGPSDSSPGPLAYVGVAEHQGFWPWSDREYQLYGISAETGAYRFLDLAAEAADPGVDDTPVALSPDGTYVAYPEVMGAREGEGISIDSLVDGTATSLDLGDPTAQRIDWLTWSPDGSQLAVGRSLIKSDSDGQGGTHGTRLPSVLVDLATMRATEIPGDDFDFLSAPTWKQAGPDSPGGVTSIGGRGVMVVDPSSGERVANYGLPKGSSLTEPLQWNADGSRFVATEQDCMAICGTHDYAIVTGTVSGASGDAEVEAIASGKNAFWLLGWQGDDVLGISGRSNEPSLVRVMPDGRASSDLEMTSYLQPSILATDLLNAGMADASPPSGAYGAASLTTLVAFCLLAFVVLAGMSALVIKARPDVSLAGLPWHAWRVEPRLTRAVFLAIFGAGVINHLVLHSANWLDAAVGLVAFLLAWGLTDEVAGGSRPLGAAGGSSCCSSGSGWLPPSRQTSVGRVPTGPKPHSPRCPLSSWWPRPSVGQRLASRRKMRRPARHSVPSVGSFNISVLVGLPEARLSLIRSITDESASVVTSPVSRFSATSRSSRRMILPDRVFGSSGTTMIVFGFAIAPISLATWSRSSATTSAPPSLRRSRAGSRTRRSPGRSSRRSRRRRPPRRPSGATPAPTRSRWSRGGGRTRSSRRRRGRAARCRRRRRAWRRRRRSSVPGNRDQ